MSLPKTLYGFYYQVYASNNIRISFLRDNLSAEPSQERLLKTIVPENANLET